MGIRLFRGKSQKNELTWIFFVVQIKFSKNSKAGFQKLILRKLARIWSSRSEDGGGRDAKPPVQSFKRQRRRPKSLAVCQYSRLKIFTDD